MSPMIKAVVALLSVTALSSGTGGASTFFQSSIISAEAHAANVRTTTTAAAIAAPPIKFRIFDITSSLGDRQLNPFVICQARVYPTASQRTLLRDCRNPLEYITRPFFKGIPIGSIRPINEKHLPVLTFMLTPNP